MQENHVTSLCEPCCVCLQYNLFVGVMERLLKCPFVNSEKDFIMQYKVSLSTQNAVEEVPPVSPSVFRTGSMHVNCKSISA